VCRLGGLASIIVEFTVGMFLELLVYHSITLTKFDYNVTELDAALPGIEPGIPGLLV